MTKARIKVEVCVASVEAACAAESAGADRIELNCALELDGLTPPAGLFQRVRAQVQLPIIAMARPRAGDFDYSDDEWQTLLADARWLIEHVADGIAFGCVTEKVVYLDRVQEMRQLVGEKELVFHKAFEEAEDWQIALSQLADAGVDRVMTSGRAPVAADQTALIAEMVQFTKQLKHPISVLPAGRVSSENAGRLVAESGVAEIHGSFCLLYTSPSPRDLSTSRMPSSA